MFQQQQIYGQLTKPQHHLWELQPIGSRVTRRLAWSLCSEVITFKAIAGPHSGCNLSHYFVSLSEHIGIITHSDSMICSTFFLPFYYLLLKTSKQFCVTAENTSNNDSMCNTIKSILNPWSIYSFNPFTQHLPCLAILNLTISYIFSAITNIGVIDMTTTIWIFDPNLP